MITFLTNQIVLRGTAAACFMIGGKMLDYVVFYNARKRSKEQQQKADEALNQMLRETQEQIRKEAEMKMQAQVDEWAKKMKEENEEWEQTQRKKTEESLEKARKIFDGHTRDMEKFKMKNPELFDKMFTERE